MKNKVRDICRSIIKAYKRFPIFILLSNITMLFLSIVIGTNFDSEQLQRIINFLVILLSGIALVESKYYKADIKKLLLCFIISIISGLLVNYGLAPSNFQDVIIRIEFSFIIICILLTVYNLYKSSDNTFNEYFTKVAINIIKISIVNIILAAGIAIIGVVFNFLIVETQMLIPKLELLLLGFYYIPNFAISFTNISEVESKYIVGIIKYVLSGLLYISYCVLYIYLLKIILTLNLPENEVFEIVTLLLLFGFPVWTMVSYLKETKLNKLLPILFIPFILLQISALGIRVVEYGITPQRYLGVMLIIIEIIYVLFYILKKEYIPNILLIMCFIVLVSGIIPVVNMYDASNYSQYNRLKLYDKNKELTNDEKKKIYGAYTYLNHSEGGKKYIDKLLSYSDIKKIKNYDIYNSIDYKYIYANTNKDIFNIEGYSTLKMIYEDNYSLNKSIENVFSDIKVDNYSLDISDIINSYIENENNLDDYFENNNEIVINDNTKLILTNISISLDRELVEYYEFNGYLLIK